MLSEAPPAENGIVRMENITKRFPGILANDGVHLHVQPGAFHAVIGENGAGKSTLLNILYGRYRPDEGRVFLAGEEVTHKLHSPSDAIRRGVGLVSQHYALIPALTVLENVIMGAEPAFPSGVLNKNKAAEQIRELAGRLDMANLDLNVRAERLSIAAQQKVEILKALFRKARLLLLDEPTATLAPAEADSLFALLHTLVREGATIIFVTHKLREVMAHSSAVSVLRSGRSVGDFVTTQTNEQELLIQMIGAKNVSLSAPLDEGMREPGTGNREPENAGFGVSGYESAAGKHISLFPVPGSRFPDSSLLQIENVTILNARKAAAVQNVSLSVGAGEIVGVAGVDGSGQRELSEAIAGLRRLESGKIFLGGREITRLTVKARQNLGVAYIPEDRHRAGMIADFTLAENYLLGHQRQREWGGGTRIAMPDVVARTADMLRRSDVRTAEAGPKLRAGSLSGGNQQKIVIARAMDGLPRLLVACQPTRGLDVEASRFVYKTLREARAQGLGILLFSLDLEEVLRLSDRVAVMFAGKIGGILPRSQATAEAVGALMTGASLPNPPQGNALNLNPGAPL